MTSKSCFKNFILSSLLAALTCSSSWAGGEKVGNGGGAEVEFASIRSELSAWVKARFADGSLARKLDLASSDTHVSSLELYSRLSKAIASVGPSVLFQDAAIGLSGYSTAPAGRICGNSSRPAQIICNNALWNASAPQIKYAIVFHEYLGVAGIETNRGEYSQYPISKNIVQYVRHADRYELRADPMSRPNAAEEIEAMRKRMEELQNFVASPSAEDLVQYLDYANGVNADGLTVRGIIRLLDRQSYRSKGYNFQACYYSFGELTHDYGNETNIGFEQGLLTTGFGGLDYGFFSDLGNVDLSSLTLSSPGIPFADSYQAPGGRCEGPAPSVRAEQVRIMHDEAGFAHADGYTYISVVRPIVGHTYLLRSIHYGKTDMLVAFQVVRQDPADGSIILIWQFLKAYAPINCERDHK